MVVIDELTSFKNRTTKRWKAIRKVRSSLKKVVGLTGTPIANGLLDLWAQVWLLDQGESLGKVFQNIGRHILTRINEIKKSFTPEAQTGFTESYTTKSPRCLYFHEK